jgi:hypothetical protein
MDCKGGEFFVRRLSRLPLFAVRRLTIGTDQRKQIAELTDLPPADEVELISFLAVTMPPWLSRPAIAE